MKFTSQSILALLPLTAILLGTAWPVSAQQPHLETTAPVQVEQVEGTAPHLKPDEAIEIAATFCRKLGITSAKNTESLKGQVLFPAPNPFRSQPAYMHPSWRVTFPQVATIEVDDVTGNIAFYSNDALWAKRSGDTRPLDKVTMANQEQVMNHALQALDAMRLYTLGGNENLVFGQMQASQETSPATVGGANWYLSWRRLFHGLPFRGQELTMQFDGEEGALFRLNLNYTLTSPTSDTIKILPEEASHLISQHLSRSLPRLLETKTDQISKVWAQRFKEQPTIPLVAQMQLEVVHPNDFWRSGLNNGQTTNIQISKIPDDKASRVCWTGRYKMENRYYEVWIDAETGEVVGGTESSSTTH